METKNKIGGTPEKNSDVQTEPEKLLEVLQSLEDLITKQTSLRFAFLRGAVYGLGTVIGATILIALLGGILASTIDSLADWPLIGNYIDANGSQYLEEIQTQQ